LVSHSTQQQCQNLVFRTVDKVKVKGKTEAVTIYEPIDPDLLTKTEFVTVLQQHEQALACYLQQNWAEAEMIWTGLQHQSGHKLYDLYLQRINYYRQQPPGAEWDGVYTHAEK
jgi:adenylate cyclase